MYEELLDRILRQLNLLLPHDVADILLVKHDIVRSVCWRGYERVIAYAVDLLIRRHGLPIEIVAKILAPPFWDDIDRAPDSDKELWRKLRQVYGSLLLNGPFTVIIAHNGEMIGLTDRIRLRPLTVGTKDSTLYLSSEESAIRLICPDLDRAWIPVGGEPIVGSLQNPIVPQASSMVEKDNVTC